MTFAYSCKDEIMKNTRTKKELKALVLGFLLSSSLNGDISINLNNQEVIDYIIEVLPNAIEKKAQIEKVRKNITLSFDDYQINLFEIKEYLYALDNLKRQFLAGIFLAKGSVNDPVSNKYHLELTFKDPKVSVYVLGLINEYGFNAKISKRRDKYLVYIKDAEKIVDFIRLIGAENNAFSYEDVRIQKDFKNSVNRLLNCEIANEQKAIEAAREQLRYIKYLEYNYPLEKIDQKTLLVMKVRKDNPDANMKELLDILANKYGFNISKPNLAHKFKKIKDLANEDYQNQKN